jgi:hypothetical protein
MAYTHNGGATGANARANDGGAIGYFANTEEGGAIGLKANSTLGAAVGQETETKEGGSLGFNAYSINGGAIGSGASTSNGGAVGYSGKSTGGGAVGYNAETTIGAAVGQQASSKNGAALGISTKAEGGVAAGDKAISTDGGAVGASAVTQNGLSGGLNSWSLDGFCGGRDTQTSDGVAAGKSAKTIDSEGVSIDAIQLGTGINYEPKTLQVYDYKLMNADGTIPKERIFDPTEIILPSTLYGVSGQEINVYKENLMLYNRLHKIPYIHTSFGNEQNDYRTIWNPNTDTVVEQYTNFEVYIDNLYTMRPQTIKLCSVPKNTGSNNIKVLIIGDSKVESGFISHHFLHNFDDDNMTVTMLGTRYTWAPENRNEGYSGKTANWFCTANESPFSNNGAFDFANYLSVNSIDTPNFVFINLGTNDCGISAFGFEDTFVTYLN